MNDKNSINDLPGHLKENPFSVPENYFNDLSSKLALKIQAREAKKVKTIRLVKLTMAAAAVVAVIVTGSVFLSRLMTSEKTATDPYLANYTEAFAVDEIEEETIIEFIGYGQDDIPSINTDEIANYLIDNDIEYEYLIEEL